MSISVCTIYIYMRYVYAVCAYIWVCLREYASVHMQVHVCANIYIHMYTEE